MGLYRGMPDLCEACNTFPCVGLGVTFRWAPHDKPPFPYPLREAVLWICGAPECEAKARARAVIGARREGVRAPATVLVRSPLKSPAQRMFENGHL